MKKETYEMRHYSCQFNQIITYSDGTKNVSEVRGIIRSKGDLTKNKINNWIKRNTTKYITFEFIKCNGYSGKDAYAYNI